MKVGEYRTVVNVIVVADVRGAAESVYLGATRSDEFFFLNRCGSSYQDSLPLAKLGLSTLSLLGSSGSNGISLWYNIFSSSSASILLQEESKFK